MNVQEATLLTEIRERAHRGTGEPLSTDERWVVTQAKSGSSTAFGELYDRHRRKVYRTAYRILRNRHDPQTFAGVQFPNHPGVSTVIRHRGRDSRGTTGNDA